LNYSLSDGWRALKASNQGQPNKSLQRSGISVNVIENLSATHSAFRPLNSGVMPHHKKQSTEVE
jgi:hypothetical protein